MIILLYHELHKLAEENKYKYSISQFDFDAQLNMIEQASLNVLTADDLINKTIHKYKNGSDLLITFDDGHLSNFNIAMPLIANKGLKATFFITTDWIGKKNYMNERQIFEMFKQGMSIQSHGKTHNFLDEMSEEDVYDELSSSKLKLENIVGQEVLSLSIPGGRLNNTVIKCAKTVGYKNIFTSIPFQIKNVSGIWSIGRIGIKAPLNSTHFNKLLSPSKSFVFHLKTINRGKQALKLIVGGRLYYNLWKIFVKK